MPIIKQPRPTHRPCAWCATEFAVVHRPGRPRLYCNHTCRQRAYELRYGINPSNELAQIRALLDETREQRITATDTINWVTTNHPLAA